MSHFVFYHLTVKQPVVVQIGAIVAVDARFGCNPHAPEVVTAQRKHTVAAKSAAGRYLVTVEHFALYCRQGPAWEIAEKQGK